MSRTMRVGLVGCGKVGQIHADALATLPGAELAAVCDADESRARAFADRSRALFGSWYEFFPRSEGARFDEATGKELLEAAHQVCPYSNATRGNIDVHLNLA